MSSNDSNAQKKTGSARAGRSGPAKAQQTMPAESMRETKGMAGSPGSAMRATAAHDDASGNAMSLNRMNAPSKRPTVAGTGPRSTQDHGDEQPPRRKCAAMDVHHRFLAESENYRRARAAIENQTISLLAADNRRRFAGIARIPVVIHVVWNTAQQNISDAQISSQIDVLNRDFRAINPDISTVPSVFQGLVADARVEFSLATVDPWGAPTNGVTRTQTSVISFNDNDAVKFAASGGADASGYVSSAAACSATRSSRAEPRTPTEWSSPTTDSGLPAPRRRRSISAARRHTKSVTF
jgi:hypothetical protein